MKKNKVLSLLVALSIIISLFTFVGAEYNGTLSVSAPSSAMPGETFNVTVSMPGGSDAVSGSFNLVYDNTVLEVSTATAGTILKDYNVNINPSYAQNKIRFTFEGEEPLSKGGIALTVSFKILSSASGKAHFECEKFKLLDADYNTISTTESASADTFIINDASTVISIDCPENAQSGDTKEVLVKVENPLNIYGGSFNLVYDAEKFTLSSATAGSLLSSFSKQINKTYAENKVRVIFAGSSAVAESGSLVKFVFTVNDGTAGVGEFSLEKLKISDSNGVVLECAAEKAQMNVTCLHNNMEWTVTTPSTCTEDGVETYLCGCGYANGTRAITKTGHKHFDWITSIEPTCTESGMEEYACLKCGYVQETREIDATGHQHMEWVTTVDETCENEGVKEYKCADCGYVERTENVPAHGHIYEDTVTPPTKTEGGYTTHTCKSCGISYTDSETPALGFDITFNANGGSGAPDTQNKKVGQSISISETAPTRDGYTFVGWATSADAAEAAYYGGNEYTEDADIALYAVWSANQHTVTYIVDGEVYKVQTYDFDALIETESEPIKEGYTFSGWSDIPIKMPDNNVEVAGSFVINTYTLSFNANGGDNAPEAVEAEYGTQLTISATTPSKANSVFVGWAKTATARKAQYYPNDKIEVKENIILYAVWGQIWNGTVAESFAGGNGTKTNPYRISTAEQLAFLAQRVNAGDEVYKNACYILVNNIVLNDTSNVANWATAAPANEWIPIGRADNPFCGTFDGNGYTVSGLYINKTGDSEEDSFQGLFGVALEQCTLSNLGLINGYIHANNEIGALAGGIIGTIKNCYNECSVSGKNDIGGLTGSLRGGIINSYNTGNINGNRFLGGLVGGVRDVDSSTVTRFINCENSGSVSGTSSHIGGVAGYVIADNYYNEVVSCNNKGEINGQSYVGGVIGYTQSNSTQSIEINKCYNYGDISGSGIRIAGIVGHAQKTSVSYCYNVASVSTVQYSVGGDCGGICGYAAVSSKIANCYNVGSITTSCGLGGIASLILTNSEITNCLNFGTIKGNDIVGGICGGYNIGSNPILKSINIGTVTGNSNTGAIVGTSYASGIDSCYYLNTCNATGAGKALTYNQLQSAANYAYYSTTYNNQSWSDAWQMGSNPFAVYPMLKGMDNLMENPIEFELNGGKFDEYELCASVVLSTKNTERGFDYLVLYTDEKATTGTSMHGYEVVVNSRGIVTDIQGSKGNAVIPMGGFVLSGHGIMSEWIQNNVTIGDKVTYDPVSLDVKVYKKNPTFTYATGHLCYLPTPTKDGYVFSGWYDENENLIKYYNPINRTGLLKIHAKWTVPQETNTITYNGNVYKLFDTPTAAESAEDYCNSIGGHLVAITSAEENAQVASLIANGKYDGYFIGANDTATEGSFVWNTGESFTYNNWKSGEPNNISPEEDTIVITKGGGWNDYKYYSYVLDVGFICEIENLTPSNATIYNGHLYQSFDKHFSWEQAKIYCEQIGGHLATITSADENEALKSLVENQAQAWYWLGGTDEESEGIWKWVTGEEWSYSHWNTAQPDNSGGKEHYLHIYTNKQSTVYNGFWNDAPQTYNTTIGFVCEYDTYNMEPVLTTKYNSHTYQVFDNVLSWQAAKEYCESLGGHLVTITSEEEQNALLTAITENNAGSNITHYWLGASNDISSQSMRWITGESFEYSNLQDYSSETNCWLDLSVASGKWWAYGSYYPYMGFICEFEPDNVIRIGEYVQMGTYYGQPILWRCVDIDENGPLMLSDKILCLKPFDAAGNNTSGSHSRGYYINGIQGYSRQLCGSDYWSDSNIRDWLNSEATSGNVLWTCGNPPIADAIWYGKNPYENEAGFLTNFGQNELHLIKTVPQKSLLDGYEWSDSNNTRNENYHRFASSITDVIQNYSTAYSENVSDTVFLLDVKQINSVYNNKDVLGSDYYIGKLTTTAVTESNFKDSAVVSGAKWLSWLRTPNSGYQYGERVRYVDVNGDIGNDYAAWDGRIGVRPAFYLNTSTNDLFNGVGTSENPYYLEGNENPVVKYSLYYDGVLSQTAPSGANITLSSPEERENMTFLGWATTENATEAEYVAGTRLTITADIYLYSVWQGNEPPIQKYSVNYESENAIILTENFEDTAVISDIAPTRSGYTFLGWSTNKNATEVEYVAGDTFDINDDMTLYAIWQNGVTYTEDNGLKWNVTDNVLTVLSGTMPNYTSTNPAPWNECASDITKIVIADGITSVGDYAFYRFTNVTEVELADSAKAIGKYAFSNCSALETVDLSKVTAIGDYAFRYCSALESVEVSKNTTYGNSVFANSGVEGVTIESGIKRLPTNAFANCEDIANVTISISVTDTNNAFSGTHIDKISYAGTKAQFEKIMDGLSFDEVECLADSETYYPADFEDNTVPVESVTLDSQYLGLEIGDTPILTATVLPDEATDKTVVWTSSNELVATVDENGQISALAVGVSDITAASADGKVKATCTVYVSKTANSTEPTLYASNVTTKNSDTFEIAVSLQNNPGLASMRVKIDFNDSVMQLIDVEDMGILGDDFHSEDYDTTPYTLYWDNGTVSQNFTENGDIAKLTFKVYDNVKSGEYPITVTCDYDNADAINCELVTVQVDTVDGNVSIDSFTYGDVDDSGKVNALDSALLSRFIAKWQGVTINLDAADVNKDTKVNPLDSAILKRHIANWTAYKELPFIQSGISLFDAEPKLMGTENGTVTVSSGEGYYDDAVDVYVSLSDNPGFVTMRLQVDYDTEVFELIEVTDLGTVEGETHSSDYSLYPYVLYWDNGAATENIVANGNIAKLTFKVKDGATVGNHSISVSYDNDNYEIFDKDLGLVEFDTVAGNINVLGEKPSKPEIIVSNVAKSDKVTCDVRLVSPNALSGVVLVGLYGDDILLDFNIFDAQKDIPVTINSTKGTTLKAMWWEGFGNMRPLAEAVEKTIE